MTKFLKNNPVRAAVLAAPAALLAAPLAAQDQAPVQQAPAARSAPVAEGAAGTIMFYRRGTIKAAARACPIRYQGEEVTELARGRFAEWRVAPGRYVLENLSSSVEVNVAPGETRYVRCQIKGGLLGGWAELQIVDGTEFARHSDSLKRSAKSPQ
ncbi:MAG: hypothetical protein ACXIT4_06675 [Erythrobacter sp.]